MQKPACSGRESEGLTMIMIRAARHEDWPVWHRLDPELALFQFERKARDREAFILYLDGAPAAALRFQLFLDRYPLLTMLAVDEAYRDQYLGEAFLSQWEQDLAQLGYTLALASENACGEDFLRRQGYGRAGQVEWDLKDNQMPVSGMYVKAIRAGCACGHAEDGKGE